MCGLFGFARNKSTKIATDNQLADYIEQASLVGTLRGKDSYGIGFVAEKYRHVEKFPLSGAQLFGTPVMEDIRVYAKQAFVSMGHHRARTVGSTSKANAHPFEMHLDGKYIMGTHNGTLTSWVSSQDGRNFSVDSQWLLYMLLKEGADFLKTVTGAYSLAYVQSGVNSLFLATNGARPLSYGLVEKENALIYASEDTMLTWLADRNNIVTEGEFWDRLPDHSVVEFPLDDLRKQVVTDVTPVKPKTVTYGRGYYGAHNEVDQGYEDMWDNWKGSGTHKATGGGGVTKGEMANADSLFLAGRLVPFNPMFVDYGGKKRNPLSIQGSVILEEGDYADGIYRGGFLTKKVASAIERGEYETLYCTVIGVSYGSAIDKKPPVFILSAPVHIAYTLPSITNSPLIVVPNTATGNPS